MSECFVQSKAKLPSHSFIHILSITSPPHTHNFWWTHNFTSFLIWRICSSLLVWLLGPATCPQQYDSLSVTLLEGPCYEFSFLCLLFEYALKSRGGLWQERMACQDGSVSHGAFLNHEKAPLFNDMP